MVKQKKRMGITQSGKNYGIKCAIQGERSIWKQKIWPWTYSPQVILCGKKSPFPSQVSAMSFKFLKVLFYAWHW